MRGEIRQRLTTPQQLRARGIPRETEGFRVSETHRAARAARDLQPRESGREDARIQDDVRHRSRSENDGLVPLQQATPCVGNVAAAFDVGIRKAFRFAFLELRNHARDQPVGAGRITPVLEQLRLEQHVRLRPCGVVESRQAPPLRLKPRDAMLEIAVVAFEERVVVLEAMRPVDRDPPLRVRLQILHHRTVAADQRTLQHKASGVGHDRARRAEQGRPVRHPRHVENDGREDVGALAQQGREIEGLVEVVIDVALGRTASHAFAVAVEKVATVARDGDG